MTGIRRRSAPPPPPPAAPIAEIQRLVVAATVAPIELLDRRLPPLSLDGGPAAPLAARPSAPAATVPADPLRARRDLARTLVRIGGSATEADVAPVMTELLKLPTSVLRVVALNGFEPGTEHVTTQRQTQIVVCRGSITDHLQYLCGVQPPGWPAGSTWDDVSGVYAPQANAVVIATVADPDQGRIVPSAANQHGGHNLVVHEVMHAYLALTGIDAQFVAAHKQDSARLPAMLRGDSLDAYTETYAEAAARYFSGDTTLFEDWPALGAYFFDRFPPGSQSPRGRP